MFSLKFEREVSLSVVTLNACMYLSGIVHWFAILLLLLPSVPVGLLVSV